MKTSAETQPPFFAPVRIEIICETQNELDALGTLVNCSTICEAAEKVFGGAQLPDFEVFRSVGADINQTTKFMEAVTQIQKRKSC